MFRLLETIKLSRRNLCNLEYHQRRFNTSQRDLFGLNNKIDLSSEIKIPTGISDSVFKVRVLYSEIIHDVEFHPYIMRTIGSLQIVNGDEVNYSYKYEDRSNLQKLLCKCTADEVLIIKNGFVTDTSYSNIVFSKEGKFYTPSTYLLNGTKRQKLLDDGMILERDIALKDMLKYEKIFLINSMIDIDVQPGIAINQIKGVDII
ncbi:MAG: para-aminobenzoate synthase component I [Ignavibacteria bacterium]|nr:MAG: para-aminobenzoate synthase component I [Ignavibacteria bacterium]KAF0156389.1 MAG: para-aminobenzoate synthase component I [Ignavibacteria bacterium]